MHAEIEKQWNRHVENHEEEFDNIKNKNLNKSNIPISNPTASNPTVSNPPASNLTTSNPNLTSNLTTKTSNIPNIPVEPSSIKVDSNKTTTNDMKFFDMSEAKKRLQEMHQDVSNSWNQYEAKQSATAYTGSKESPVDPILLKLNKLSMQDLKKLMKVFINIMISYIFRNIMLMEMIALKKTNLLPKLEMLISSMLRMPKLSKKRKKLKTNYIKLNRICKLGLNSDHFLLCLMKSMVLNLIHHYFYRIILLTRQ